MTLSRIDGVLAFEGQPLDNLAETFGTPSYIYSAQTIASNYHAFEHAFRELEPLICYAVKANANLSILAKLASLGSGFDIVSGGELARVKQAGGSTKHVVFSGVGKTANEIRDALIEGIHCFNVESEAELSLLASIAESLGVTAPVSIRVNPDVDPKTHPYIATGLLEAKFGLSMNTALDLYREGHQHPHLNMTGIDCHIGSQITDIEPFKEAASRLLDLTDTLRDDGIQLRHIDLGGGIGIQYQEEELIDLQALAQWLKPLLDQRALQLILEPGRSIVADAGLLLTRVLHTKVAERKHFCVVDAAMNDLLRPSLYGAWQRIEAVEPNKPDAPEIRYDVVGPICETGDFLGKDRPLVTESGHHLAILDAGAYGFGMGSNYNTRPRGCEVLIEEGTARVIRRRESLDDLLAHELDGLKSS